MAKGARPFHASIQVWVMNRWDVCRWLIIFGTIAHSVSLNKLFKEEVNIKKQVAKEKN